MISRRSLMKVSLCLAASSLCGAMFSSCSKKSTNSNVSSSSDSSQNVNVDNSSNSNSTNTQASKTSQAEREVDSNPPILATWQEDSSQAQRRATNDGKYKVVSNTFTGNQGSWKKFDPVAISFKDKTYALYEIVTPSFTKGVGGDTVYWAILDKTAYNFKTLDEFTSFISSGDTSAATTWSKLY